MKQDQPIANSSSIGSSNQLFPVFLKLENMRVLVVGGGNVGLEKLNAIVHNSPATQVRLVAVAINEQVRALAEKHSNIQLEEKEFEEEDLNDVHVVIVAVNDPAASKDISTLAKKRPAQRR